MNRLIKSLATVMGAAALIVAPMAIVAPSAQAETLTVPDRKVEGTPEANQPAFWVDYLEDERGITGATCRKIDGGDKTFELAAPPAGTKYVLAVTKAADENALPEGEFANWVFFDPEQGDVLTAVQGKGISHIILCTVPTTATPPADTPPGSTPPVGTPPADTPPGSTPPVGTPPADTPPASTPPVIETDRVDGGSGAGLGLFGAAAALLLGAGAIVIGRRRQGDHR